MDIEEKIKEYSNMVYKLAFSILKNEADSEDIYQQTFFKFYENLDKIKNKEHEKAWLIRVTINNCNMLLRKRKINSECELKEEVLEIPAEENEDTYILELVNQLPEKYRIIIYLFYYENYKISEICKILNENEGTIKSKLSRARKILGDNIKKEEI